MVDLFDIGEGQRTQAIRVAMRAKVLEPCRLCGDDCCVANYSLEDAYRLGSKMFKDGKLPDFDSQRQVTDTIQEVVADAYDGTPGYCSRCDLNFHSD